MRIPIVDLPGAAKLAVRIRDGEAYGYASYRSEALAASLGETTPPDVKETFSAVPLGAAPAGRDDEAASFVHSPNR
jgi:hypothetical protein